MGRFIFFSFLRTHQISFHFPPSPPSYTLKSHLLLLLLFSDPQVKKFWKPNLRPWTSPALCEVKIITARQQHLASLVKIGCLGSQRAESVSPQMHLRALCSANSIRKIMINWYCNEVEKGKCLKLSFPFPLPDHQRTQRGK